jgi:DNA polymerase III alpha subunit
MVDKMSELNTGYYVCTDNGYLTDTFKAYNYARKKGLKPVLGCELYIIPSNSKIYENTKSQKIKYFTITLHAKTQSAYQYLVKKISEKDRKIIKILEHEYPTFTWEDLEDFSTKDFTAVIGGAQCIVSKNLLVDEIEVAKKSFIKLLELFKNNLYSSIIPMEFDKKWITSSVFTFSNGQTVRLDSNILAETDFANTYRVSLEEVAEKFERHKTIKRIYVNGVGYNVNKSILSAENYKEFKLIGKDIFKLYNEFIYGLSKEYSVKILINDYSYFAHKDDQLVQNLKLGEEIRIYTNNSIKSSEEAFSYLSKFYNELEIEEFINNSYEWANKFDNFELKYEYRMVKEHANSLQGTMELIKKIGRFDINNPEHKKRLKHEIDVIHANGTIDLLPYFFPISKALNYYTDNGRVVGPARGCLTSNTSVYTKQGIKKLNQIKIGDYVISHTGKWRKVTDTMEYNVNEELLKIKTQYSYIPNTMTKDHKVYGIKRNKIKNYTLKTKKYEDWNENDLKWYKAEEMEEGDLLFTPWPETKIRTSKLSKNFDLQKIFPNNLYDDSFIYIDRPLYNNFSLRKIAENTGLSKFTIKKVKNGKQCKKYNLEKIIKYLEKNNSTLDEWINNKNIKTLKIKRFIDFDKKLYNLIGRWIGDGWLVFKKNEIGICFNTNEKEDIEYYTTYIKSLGFKLSEKISNKKDLVQYTIRNKNIYNLFHKMFPKYKNTSSTKYLSFFRHLPDKELRWVIEGIIGADGYVRNNTESQFKVECIDTTSIRLLEEIRECLLFLKIPSSVYIRKPFIRQQNDKKYLCKQSYKIKFYGITEQRSDFFNFTTSKGYFSKITNITKETDTKVYDITVEKDHSYTTVDYVVHNSSGGSFLMYCMGITQVNPLKYGLYFSRFLTLGRIQKKSLPDVDVDMPDRDLLVNEGGFLDTFYKDRWSQISTRTLIKLKSAIRDVNRFKKGKVEDEIETFAKNLEAAPQGISDKDFVFGYEDTPGLIEKDRKLRDYIEKRPEEWEIVKKSLGVNRQHGRHASAFVIADIPINEIVPTMKVSDSENVTQYEAKEIEAAGLIKYDFLVVKCLNDIELAIKKINQEYFYNRGNRGGFDSGHFFHKGDNIYIWDLPEEQEVFDMLAEGKTETVFQLNTVSVTPFVQSMKPTSVEDCAVVTSLVRPGPLEFIDEKTGRNMAEEYIERRQGRSKGDIPILDELIPETYGIMVYQEQITLITKALTGWDDEKAEDVRIAVGKKQAKMIDEIRPQFIDAAAKFGRVDSSTAEIVWAMIEKFGRYGFNKSHAVAYSMIAYACAYLKHHYPLEWWAAVLSNAEEKEITEVLWPHVKDILSPPDINLSNEEMVIDYTTGTIRNKLSVLKGLGVKVANSIIEGRPYLDIYDFVKKEKVNPSLVRSLIHVGVMDSLLPKNVNLMEKMQYFEDALAAWEYKKKMFEKSNKELDINLDLQQFIEKAKEHPLTKKCRHKIPEGKIDLKYAFMNPVKDYIFKKSTFPAMPIKLYDAIRSGTKNVKIINSNNNSYIIGKLHKEVRLINGKTYQNIKNIPSQLNSTQVVDFCIAAYVVESKEFSYQNGAKKALKLIIDIDGYTEEMVKWPDYNTGILKYPDNLKKNSVIFLFMQRKMNRDKYHTNIEDIIVEDIF